MGGERRRKAEKGGQGRILKDTLDNFMAGCQPAFRNGAWETLFQPQMTQIYTDWGAQEAARLAKRQESFLSADGRRWTQMGQPKGKRDKQKGGEGKCGGTEPIPGRA